jgi:hypothetical protein
MSHDTFGPASSSPRQHPSGRSASPCRSQTMQRALSARRSRATRRDLRARPRQQSGANPARDRRAVSGVEVSTAWARFRRRLGLAQLPAGYDSGSTLPPAAEPPTHLSREELIREFRERRSDEGELPSGAPARQGADHERGVVESLARGPGAASRPTVLSGSSDDTNRVPSRRLPKSCWPRPRRRVRMPCPRPAAHRRARRRTAGHPWVRPAPMTETTPLP